MVSNSDIIARAEGDLQRAEAAAMRAREALAKAEAEATRAKMVTNLYWRFKERGKVRSSASQPIMRFYYFFDDEGLRYPLHPPALLSKISNLCNVAFTPDLLSRYLPFSI